MLLVLTAAVAIPLTTMGIIAIVLKNTRLSKFFLPSPAPPEDRSLELRSLRATEGHTRRSADANECTALAPGRASTLELATPPYDQLKVAILVPDGFQSIRRTLYGNCITL